jgi:hypothetical protein
MYRVIEDVVDCPVCGVPTSVDVLPEHVDACLRRAEKVEADEKRDKELKRPPAVLIPVLPPALPGEDPDAALARMLFEQDQKVSFSISSPTFCPRCSRWTQCQQSPRLVVLGFFSISYHSLCFVSVLFLRS